MLLQSHTNKHCFCYPKVRQYRSYNNVIWYGLPPVIENLHYSTTPSRLRQSTDTDRCGRSRPLWLLCCGVLWLCLLAAGLPPSISSRNPRYLYSSCVSFSKLWLLAFSCPSIVIGSPILGFASYTPFIFISPSLQEQHLLNMQLELKAILDFISTNPRIYI